MFVKVFVLVWGVTKGDAMRLTTSRRIFGTGLWLTCREARGKTMIGSLCNAWLSLLLSSVVDGSSRDHLVRYTGILLFICFCVF